MKLIPQTIRVQIMMAFSVCFVFMAVMIAVNFNNFRCLSRSMQFFELAGELNNTILEMRRYEKNYFLYRQDFNFEENITYTHRLALALQKEQKILVNVIGLDNFRKAVKGVQDYTALMTKLHQKSCDSGACADIEAQIRGTGQNLLLLSDQFFVIEKQAIDKLLQQMISLPLINLLVLVVLLGFVVHFIGEKVVRPLARITRESEAVAHGAFQHITSIGHAKNEINHLVTAINYMMEKLGKRQEQLVQSRKIASIGTLTAGVAHEINNPVNNISLILESLIEDGETMDTVERSNLYQEAMDQADRASEIVKNLLEFSRANHPRLEYVNLVEVIDKTTRLVKNELKLHNIGFVMDVKAAEPKVYLDKGGLQQVLLNLFVNSIQAMENDGELKVVIRPAAIPSEIRIDIIDNGPGIPQDYLDQIFDPFFTTKKEGVGTGLGLSVSYNIIKKNKGRMEVQSQPGQGTCFSIFLPLTESTAVKE